MVLVTITALLVSADLASATQRPKASQDPVRVAEAAVLQEVNALRHRFGLPPAHSTRAYQSVVDDTAVAGTDPLVPFGGPVLEEYGVSGLALDASLLDAANSNIITSWVYNDHSERREHPEHRLHLAEFPRLQHRQSPCNSEPPAER